MQKIFDLTFDEERALYALKDAEVNNRSEEHTSELQSRI